MSEYNMTSITLSWGSNCVQQFPQVFLFSFISVYCLPILKDSPCFHLSAQLRSWFNISMNYLPALICLLWYELSFPQKFVLYFSNSANSFLVHNVNFHRKEVKS